MIVGMVATNRDVQMPPMQQHQHRELSHQKLLARATNSHVIRDVALNERMFATVFPTAQMAKTKKIAQRVYVDRINSGTDPPRYIPTISDYGPINFALFHLLQMPQ